MRADLLDGPGDQPAHDPRAGSLHSVGLAATRLAVGEQRDAVPVQGGLDEFRYLSVDGLLSGGGGRRRGRTKICGFDLGRFVLSAMLK